LIESPFSTRSAGLLSLVFVAFFSSCTIQDTLTQAETNSQIFAAASYKARECGNPIPNPFLYAISKRVPQRNVDLCTFAILRSDCPFDAFPLVCVLIYLEEFGTIPKWLDFGDLVNVDL